MRLRIRNRVSHLLRPFYEQPQKVRRIHERLLEGLREIGVLLMAFAPLDAVLVESAAVRGTLLLFLALGCFLFGAAVVLEWRWGVDH